MPIYEYRCENCGHELEALQKISDAPLTQCPGCEQSALRKRMSATAFRLKGAGWYETDFKSGNKKNLASGDKADKSADASKTGKTDSPSGSGDKAATSSPKPDSSPSKS